jgi:hypothetical protein
MFFFGCRSKKEVLRFDIAMYEIVVAKKLESAR